MLWEAEVLSELTFIFYLSYSTHTCEQTVKVTCRGVGGIAPKNCYNTFMVPLKLINSVLIMTSLLQVTVDIFASFTIIVGIFFPSVTGRSFFEHLSLNQKHRDLFVRLFFWQYRPYLFINFYPLYLSTLPIYIPIFIPIIYLSIYLSIYIYRYSIGVLAFWICFFPF